MTYKPPTCSQSTPSKHKRKNTTEQTCLLPSLSAPLNVLTTSGFIRFCANLCKISRVPWHNKLIMRTLLIFASFFLRFYVVLINLDGRLKVRVLRQKESSKEITLKFHVELPRTVNFLSQHANQMKSRRKTQTICMYNQNNKRLSNHKGKLSSLRVSIEFTYAFN